MMSLLTDHEVEVSVGQQTDSPTPRQAVLHRGMVSVTRSRAHDALFEASIIVGSLNRDQYHDPDLETIRLEIAAVELEMSKHPPEALLERVERVHQAAEALYTRSLQG